MTGSVSQSVSGFQPGATYRVHFYAAQRGNGNNGGVHGGDGVAYVEVRR